MIIGHGRNWKLAGNREFIQMAIINLSCSVVQKKTMLQAFEGTSFEKKIVKPSSSGSYH